MSIEVCNACEEQFKGDVFCSVDNELSLLCWDCYLNDLRVTWKLMEGPSPGFNYVNFGVRYFCNKVFR